jgi:hypothetical protein
MTPALPRWRLLLELAIVFVALPAALARKWIVVPPIPLLVVCSLLAFLLVRREGRFGPERMLGWPEEGVRWMLYRTAAFCAIIGIGVWWFSPSRLFDLLQEAPWLWAAVMILYPLLSVYPQEFLFRGFFFHRYRPLFRNDMSMVLASAMAFGFVHIIFGNWISVGLSAIGGILFSITYLQTKSVLVAAVEHALFGNFLFTIGLGEFFYHGSRFAR